MLFCFLWPLKSRSFCSRSYLPYLTLLLKHPYFSMVYNWKLPQPWSDCACTPAFWGFLPSNTTELLLTYWDSLVNIFCRDGVVGGGDSTNLTKINTDIRYSHCEVSIFQCGHMQSFEVEVAVANISINYPQYLSWFWTTKPAPWPHSSASNVTEGTVSSWGSGWKTTTIKLWRSNFNPTAQQGPVQSSTIALASSWRRIRATGPCLWGWWLWTVRFNYLGKCSRLLEINTSFSCSLTSTKLSRMVNDPI